MVTKIFKSLILFFSSVSICAFASVDATREVLLSHSENNERVLTVYERVVSSWAEYAQEQGEEWNLDLLLSAVAYAAEKHEGQYRKDGVTPYIVHPIGVAELLWEVGNVRSVDILAAALLHDTIEDTDATAEEIEQLFGSKVLSIVLELTDDPNLTPDENKARQIAHAETMSYEGRLVKLADRLYNLRDINPPPPSWSQEKISTYYGWGEKLLEVVRGTNAPLERALEDLLATHRVS